MVGYEEVPDKCSEEAEDPLYRTRHAHYVGEGTFDIGGVMINVPSETKGIGRNIPLRFGNCVGDTNTLTLQVDMRHQDVSPHGVHVMGIFNDWDLAGTQMHPDSNGIYTLDIPFTVDKTAWVRLQFSIIWNISHSN